MAIKNKADLTDEQIEQLIASLTVDEKIDQMLIIRDMNVAKKQMDDGENPPLYGFSFMPSDVSLEDINFIQKKVLENSRFKIPMLVMGESLHGIMHSKGTIFPQSIGMACSFNENLMEEIATVIGHQAHAVGMRQVYAPDLDLAREPRWGRTEETFGEDPYLTARMGVRYVKGIQSAGVASTLKHYVAHGSPEGGLNLSPVHMGERELREVMLEPFAACIKEANAMSVMPAYSEFDGVPVHANKFLLRKILREELGFKGTVISDYDGLMMLGYLHNIAKDSFECAKYAIEAGVDIEAPMPFSYNSEFRQAVKQGEIDIELINGAVRNILRLKSQLNLFSNPYMDIHEFSNIDMEHASKLARQAAEESIVLLKNADNILPLSKDTRIGVVGVLADCAQTGDYSCRNSQDKCISLVEGLKSQLGSEQIAYAKGCNISTYNEQGIEEAIKVAKCSDVIVVALGDNSSFFGGIGWGDKDGNNAVTCGEGFDVNSLSVPPAQRKLFDEMCKTNKPIILVMYSGRPYAITDMVERSAAVIQAWYAGEQGGTALSDIILGKISPSGRLSISFPRSTGHLPCFYNHKPSARGANYKSPGTYESPGRDYVFDTPNALFPFGYGLSYTKFEYSDITVEKTENGIKVGVSVKNVGNYDAKESVLLFLRQTTCPITPLVKRLRAFQCAYLKKGESKHMQFVLTEKDFTYIDFDMTEQVCHTNYIVYIGDKMKEFTF